MDNLQNNNKPPSLLQQSSIFLLPSELLCEIFSLVAIRGPSQLSHALFVCKHWYNIIVDDQKLWSTIILDRDFMDRLYHSSAYFNKADAYIRACLDRSAPFPLDVTLDNFCERIDESVSEKKPYRSVLNRLFKSGEPRHIQRCRSLSWYIQNSLYEIPLISSLLPLSLERLEYLSVRDFSIESDLFKHFPRCPRLKEVQLVDHFEGTSPHYFLAHDYTHVEKLTFASDSGWIDHDIPYIENFRGIHTLVLEGVTLTYSFVEKVENTSIVNLHSLKTLKLFGSIPLNIMRRINAPLLNRVDIATVAVQGSHSLDIVPLELLQSVTIMSISIHPSRSSTPFHPRHLQRVICGAPSLTCLTGTSAIGELLAGEEWFGERNIVYNCI